MAKTSKKRGRDRLDRYYKLAKESGFRARSAFKLLQLNTRHSLLSRAKCCVDLCAAPGGWLQVAEKYMPRPSIIIGVDLVPIKPIPGVISLIGDITKKDTLKEIQARLKGWQADIVLHDGAPNVGSSWLKDSYAQAELTLHAIKMATCLLSRNGTFVTKCFRSKDYPSLQWVLRQLFKSVEATKPEASRSVSAEIFVVCKGYLAPKRIDSRFFDPTFIFQTPEDANSETPGEGAAEGQGESGKVPKAGKKLAESELWKYVKNAHRRHREGYAKDARILYTEAPAAVFIMSGADPVALLARSNKIVFSTDEDKRLLAHPFTTEDVQVCCEDLKTLGKREFKLLLSWRTRMRKFMGIKDGEENEQEMKESVVAKSGQDEADGEAKESKGEEEASEERQNVSELDGKQCSSDSDDSDAASEAELAEMVSGLTKAAEKIDRKKKRKLKERRLKNLERMRSLKIAGAPELSRESVDDGDVFQLQKIGANVDPLLVDEGTVVLKTPTASEVSQKRKRREITEQYLSDSDDSDLSHREREVAIQVKRSKIQKVLRESERLVELDKEKERKLQSRTNTITAFERERGEDSEADIGAESLPSNSSGKENELLVKFAEDHGGAKLFVQHDLVREAWKEVREQVLNGARKRGMEGVIPGVYDPDEIRKQNEEKVLEIHGNRGQRDESSDDDSSGEEGSHRIGSNLMDVDGTGASGAGPVLEGKVTETKRGKERSRKVSAQENDAGDAVKLHDDASDSDPDELDTPEKIALAQLVVKNKHTVVNDSFNRWTFGQEGNLPGWFLQDQKKFCRPIPTVTKEAVLAWRERMKALDARPIKKVAEAKMRKKMRALKRAQKIAKKMTAIYDEEGPSEANKAKAMQALIKKSGKKLQRRKTLVVGNSRSNRGVQGRPKGVKGRYKMVDRRMKADKRGAAKREGKRGRKSTRKTSRR